MPKPSPQSPATKSTATGSTQQSAEGESSTTAKERLDEINLRTERAEEEELALKRKLVPRLAKRAYHLYDDSGWCQDWAQYQKNTHPVFGLCCYHRLHPIRLPQRVIILVGSIAFGFAITNIVYLGFLSHENAGAAVNQAYQYAGDLAEIQQRYTSVELDQAMVFLLTVGSFLHSAFDTCIWYLMACFCCRPGGPCQGDADGKRCRRACQTFGIHFAVLVVMVAVVAATTVAVVRLSKDQSDWEEEQSSSSTLAQEIAADELELDGNGTTNKSLIFAVGYLLELTFALFVFYPLTSTVFFSGILGCGRIPVFGGRPYEMRKRRLKDDGDDDDDENEVEDVRGTMAYDV